MPADEKPYRRFLRRLRRSSSAVIGAVVLSALILIAILAPQLAPFDPTMINPDVSFMTPGVPYYFGTDLYGRDVFSRVLYGAQISLRIGLFSVLLGSGVGLVLGLISGYLGGWVDTVIMRIMDGLLAFPGLLLALAIVAALGSSLTNVMIAVGISGIPGYTRLVRATVLSARENLYVEAARALGAPTITIMFRHILPNVFAPVLVLVTLGTGSSMILAAALSFLGMGAQPPAPEWGLMLSEGRNYLNMAWWVSTFPGLAIMLAALSVNLVGDGLRDALDPRTER